MIKPIKVSLRGSGGELDSRIIHLSGDYDDEFDDMVSEAVISIASSCVFAIGDCITIEEINS